MAIWPNDISIAERERSASMHALAVCKQTDRRESIILHFLYAVAADVLAGMLEESNGLWWAKWVMCDVVQVDGRGREDWAWAGDMQMAGIGPILQKNDLNFWKIHTHITMPSTSPPELSFTNQTVSTSSIIGPSIWNLLVLSMRYRMRIIQSFTSWNPILKEEIDL